MKKRILTFGLLLLLVTVLAIPGVVMADSTWVGGEVLEGYTFTAPSPIFLASMTPSATPYKDFSTDGSLVGNDPNGYTVTGIDAKGTNTGYMVSGGGTPLTNKHQISDEDANYVPADTAKTFVDTSWPTDVAFSLCVSQMVDINDTPAADYEIQITFTVTPKP